MRLEKSEITKELAEQGVGQEAVNFKLRDWLFSRQRFWGEPFPIIYDSDGIAHTMNVDDLPLELPELDDFKPAAGGKFGRATDVVSQDRNWVIRINNELGAEKKWGQLYTRKVKTKRAQQLQYLWPWPKKQLDALLEDIE